MNVINVSQNLLLKEVSRHINYQFMRASNINVINVIQNLLLKEVSRHINYQFIRASNMNVLFTLGEKVTAVLHIDAALSCCYLI